MQSDDSTGRGDQAEATPTATPPLRLADLLDGGLLKELSVHFARLGQCAVSISDERGHRIVSSAVDPDAPTHRAPLHVHGQHVGEVEVSTVGAPPVETPNAEAMNAVLPEVLAGVISTLAEQRSATRRRLDELGTVCDLTGLLSGTDNLAQALATVAERVANVMGVKAAAIRLVNKDNGQLVMGASHNLSREYLDKGVVTLYESPIDRAALAGETVYIEDAGTDPRMQYAQAARREGLVSGLCVPMAYRGETVGLLRIYSDRHQRFSTLESALLRAIGTQVAAAIVHTRLADERLANERYRSQLVYASEIQRRMISVLPEPGRLSFGAEYDPALEVGGDFYDFVHLPQENLGVCIADVSGKGVPAALLMAALRASLRAHADSTYHLNEIIAKVNDRLCRDTLVNEFATLFYGVFSTDGSQFTYCNAGHEPPLLLRGDSFQQLRAGGMALGIDPSETYHRTVVDLQSDDVIVMVTDGVTEALNFDDEPFGRERLVQSVRRYHTLTAPLLAKQILWDVRRFIGLADRIDDLTVVTAKVG